MPRARMLLGVALVVWVMLVSYGFCLFGLGGMDETAAAAAQQFVVLDRPLECVGRLGVRHTASLEEAMVVCLRTRGCTVTSRQRITGLTLLCKTSHRYRTRLKRQAEEFTMTYHWLYQTSRVGSCDLYDWKLVSIHEDSGSYTMCRTIGLRAFEFQFQPIPCPAGRLLSRHPTPHLQAAAVECLDEPRCLHFARNQHTGDTLFCGRQDEGAGGGAGGQASLDGFLGSLPEEGASLPWGLVSRHGWLYACRSGECPLSARPQDQSFVLNLPRSSTGGSGSLGNMDLEQQRPASISSSSAGGSLPFPSPPFSSGAASSQQPTSPLLLESFTVVRFHAICKPLQVLTFGPTPSVGYAAHFCQAEPHCSLFARSDSTGETWFCQGYDRLENSAPGEHFVTGFRKGCEHFDSRNAVGDVLVSQPPTCYLSPAPPACPLGLHTIPVFTTGQQASPPRTLCDECSAGGVCSRLPNELSTNASSSAGATPNINPLLLQSDLTASAQRLLGGGGGGRGGGETINLLAGAINPSLLSHAGRRMVVYRVTEALRCKGNSVGGVWQLDAPEQPLMHSRIGICDLAEEGGEVNGGDVLPVNCSLLEDVGTSMPLENLDNARMMVNNYAFVGQEDPRGFSFRGGLYVLANIGIVMLPWSWEVEHRFHYEIQVRRQILLKLGEDRRVERALLISIPGTLRSQDNKNVIPLLPEDGSGVLLVHSFLPYRVCRLDLDSGACEAIDAWAALQPSVQGATAMQLGPEARRALSLNGHVRGSTPFAPTPWGYLALVHRKQEMELGRLYSHKWVLMSLIFPHAPIWLSPSFRLPEAGATAAMKAADDIQFAAGLEVHLDTSTATVTYGVADCFSTAAVVQLPVEDLAAAAKGRAELRPVFPDPAALPPAQPRQRPAGLVALPAAAQPPAITVRWDSPFTDLSGFATVSRALVQRLLQDNATSASVQIVNRFVSSPTRYEEEAQTAIYSRIVTSNLNLTASPDVTVRLHWPPNFETAPAGRLAVYLPWEFEAIPAQWVAALNRAADEVWVPAAFVREGFLKSGINANKVHVVGHGAPDEVCRMEADPRTLFSPPGGRRRSFRFLYHGGLLWRKGVDLLLRAYASAFDVEDDTVLEIHSVYGDEEVQAYVRDFLSGMGPQSPRVHFIQRELNATELAQLYASADVLVHPSRSEGFGLGIVEAMAYGVPPIIPNYGPAVEFVSNATGFLFPARSAPCEVKPCLPGAHAIFNEDWETEQQLTWADFEPADLGAVMREAYLNPAEVEVRGQAARQHACTSLTWDGVYRVMKERLVALAGVQPGEPAAPNLAQGVSDLSIEEL